MKERPIPFSGPMVRAVLDGRKTQTRRTRGLDEVNAEPDSWTLHSIGPLGAYAKPQVRGRFGAYFQRERDGELQICPVVCPYGAPGDRLWVRETWAPDLDHNRVFYRADADEDGTVPYLISGAGGFGGGVASARIARWKPSIHMPRWASRITLEITGVRVERLQEINEKDARLEGFPVSWDGKPYDPPPPEVDSWQGYGTYSFCLYWSKLNGPGSWDANPWVWVIEFRRAA